MNDNRKPYVIFLLLTIALLSGCGRDKVFSEDDGYHTTSYTTYTVPTVAPPETPTPEVSHDNEEIVEDDGNIIIKVENLNVYINNKPIDYNQDDDDSLRKEMESFLSSIKDDAVIHTDFRYGNDDVCTVIEEVIKQMGLSVIED